MMLKSKKEQIIKEEFTELDLGGISDIDIEFLYNYIVKTQKIKRL